MYRCEERSKGDDLVLPGGALLGSKFHTSLGIVAAVTTTLGVFTSRHGVIEPPYGEGVTPLVVFDHLSVDIAGPIRLVVWILQLSSMPAFSGLSRPLLERSIASYLLPEMK